jgi:outer membrane protein assembly factor BamE (lipoprotein component of BamABCDE complex)
MATAWYYAQRGQQEGPVSEQELLQLASSGALKPTDYLWRPGLSTWVSAKDVFLALHPAAPWPYTSSENAPQVPEVGRPSSDLPPCRHQGFSEDTPTAPRAALGNVVRAYPTHWELFTTWLHSGTPRERAQRFWSISWGICAAICLVMALFHHPAWVFAFPVLGTLLFLGIRAAGNLQGNGWPQFLRADDEEHLGPCTHCQGTSSCVADRGTACRTCKIRAGLRPEAEVQQVVCSLCAGTGTVSAPDGLESTPSWDEEETIMTLVRKNAVMLKPLAACVVLLVAFSLLFSRLHAGSTTKEPAKVATGPSVKKYERKDFKRLVAGKAMGDVYIALGSPDAREVAETEKWFYLSKTYDPASNKMDSCAVITFHNGEVVALRFY